MESAVTLNFDCKITFRWQSSSYNNIKVFSGTQFPKATRYCCLSSLRPSPPAPHSSSSKTHTTLLVETYHHHRRLKALLERLEKDSCPLQILRDDGDWTKDNFWAVIRFLRHASRSNEILQVRFLFALSLFF